MIAYLFVPHRDDDISLSVTYNPKKNITIETEQKHIEYVIPINTIERVDSQFLGCKELNNGMQFSIESFTDEFKSKLLNAKVYKNGSPYYVSNPKVNREYRCALSAHHILRFKNFPTDGLNPNIKTFEYRKLIERLILLVFESCPQVIFDRPKNYQQDTWSRFIRYSQFLNRKFVRLEEHKVNQLFELIEICFNDLPNKRINAILELFEHSQLYGNSPGLRNSMFVTIMESFFVQEHQGVRRKFANRLSSYYKTKELDFQFFDKLYQARSEFYHQGNFEYNEKDEYKIMELTKGLIIEHILKMKEGL